MKQQKSALRLKKKAIRQQLHAEDTGQAARLVAAHILDLPEIMGEVQRGIKAPSFTPHIVAGFYPIQTEIDCLFILKALNAIQCRCALPVINDQSQHLVFKEWDLVAKLHNGPFGTKEPRPDFLTVMPDIILVPMLAFDETGHRLGYGGGFYDRTLEAYREQGHPFTAIGVAYEGQKRDKVPVAAYDQPLDIIVTEQKVYRP